MGIRQSVPIRLGGEAWGCEFLEKRACGRERFAVCKCSVVLEEDAGKGAIVWCASCQHKNITNPEAENQLEKPIKAQRVAHVVGKPTCAGTANKLLDLGIAYKADDLLKLVVVEMGVSEVDVIHQFLNHLKFLKKKGDIVERLGDDGKPEFCKKEGLVSPVGKR